MVLKRSMTSLKNRYYAFRHGQSRANVEGIIVSDPAVGTVRYGLTDEGRRQVHATISSVTGFDHKTLVVSSDFRRAAETAEIIRKVLGVDSVIFDERLRERFFGRWEGLPHANYAQAWSRDVCDPAHAENGAESAESVGRRMWAVIESLEQQYAGRNCILVSHGDPLMVLLALFKGGSVSQHRSFPYIETAELRALN